MVVRRGCAFPYRINVHQYTGHAASIYGFDVVTVIHEQVRSIGRVTGLGWAFEGYTSATYESAAGKEYMKHGVLIELRGPRSWSQPQPSSSRTWYSGGALFLDVGRELAHLAHQRTLFSRYVAHELGHQYGLGDTYDDVGGRKDLKVRMGYPYLSAWAYGDLAGFRASAAHCR